jgi:RNA polymerase sigma-70 factor (ECF subfamily)
MGVTVNRLQSAFDELLVLAWQDGDARAGERLARRWQPRLWRHARLLTDSAEEATDATQAAWLSMTQGRRQLAEPGRFGPWAYRIVTRRCADIVRRRQRDRTGRSAAPAAGVAAGAAAGADAAPDARADELRSAFDALDGEDRALLMLVHVDELPLRTVAEILDLPIGTVKSRLHAARRRLRDRMPDDPHE